MKSSSSQITSSSHWDIFCTVVDNYGDIGVTWRLAKQLADEYAIAVRLWVDDLASFHHILPQLNSNLARQKLNNVEILHWRTPLTERWVPGNVLIEAFACELPNEVLTRLSELATKPCWINLEYLSAEAWVDDCHGLTSHHHCGANKFFYFPGFSDKTGGLICEKSLLNEVDSWQTDSINRHLLLQELGIKGIKDSDQLISIFSYETPSLLTLCDQWRQSDGPVHALVPLGKSLNTLCALLPVEATQCKAGDNFKLDNLTLHILPMTNQLQYDRLLWSCDLNIVRGEDSFMRAQWAKRPFIWHIYPQKQDTHLIKLNAFFKLYSSFATQPDDSDKNSNQCLQIEQHISEQMNIAFNNEEMKTLIDSWHIYTTCDNNWHEFAKIWPKQALNGSDLATRLVQFVKKG